MTMLRTGLFTALIASSALVTGCASYAASDNKIAQNGSSHADLQIDANQALNELYSKNPQALELSKKAVGVLVFPKMVRAGLGFGGGYGEGELRRGSTLLGRYNSVTGSWGLQAGAQSYSYVVFLMNQEAINYLDRTDGWEIGVGPTVVVVNTGAAENISTSTEKGDAFAFIFSQQGLMAGVSIEGTKITKIAS